MRVGSRHVFIIGPGGIGKTSSGPFLSRFLKRPFVDLDAEFMARVGHIGNFIGTHGYAAYVCENSKLFFRMLDDIEAPHVMALSSGFLIPETELETVAANRRAAREMGTSIMPLPHHAEIEAANIVAKRQAQRGLGLNVVKEREKFLSRIDIYREIADRTAIYTGDPSQAANKMLEVLKLA